MCAEAVTAIEAFAGGSETGATAANNTLYSAWTVRPPIVEGYLRMRSVLC